MKRFQRTEQLIGSKAVEILAGSSVAVFGIGGVGSFAAEALARGGIGRLFLCDNDTVDITNINRQIIALGTTIGRKKTEVMAERIRDINSYAEVKISNAFFSSDTAREFSFEQFDYIVDAIDSVSSKLTLIETAKSRNIPIISCMGTGNKLDPSKFEIADISKTSVCPLARVIRTEMKKRGLFGLKVLYSNEQPVKFNNPQGGRVRAPASISFVPSVAGLMIAGEVIKDILKKSGVQI
ncbi:MAG: tRNA threonylcarbamoyladenosine dehydratase [Firmicutes bacterium]|nr:tRNA threonylcarbamoyladenosine dehydratase [Bacillota bacterium]